MPALDCLASALAESGCESGCGILPQDSSCGILPHKDIEQNTVSALEATQSLTWAALPPIWQKGRSPLNILLHLRFGLSYNPEMPEHTLRAERQFRNAKTCQPY